MGDVQVVYGENARGGGVLLGILGGGLLPGSPNFDAISDQKMWLFTPVFSQTWPLKSIPVFRDKKDFLKYISNGVCFFLS